jgi:hypothetical protein
MAKNPQRQFRHGNSGTTAIPAQLQSGATAMRQSGRKAAFAAIYPKVQPGGGLSGSKIN